MLWCGVFRCIQLCLMYVDTPVLFTCTYSRYQHTHTHTAKWSCISAGKIQQQHQYCQKDICDSIHIVLCLFCDDFKFRVIWNFYGVFFDKKFFLMIFCVKEKYSLRKICFFSKKIRFSLKKIQHQSKTKPIPNVNTP